MDRSAYNTVIASRPNPDNSYTIKSSVPALGSFPDCILRPVDTIPDSKALYCAPSFYGVAPGVWSRNGPSTYVGIVVLVLLALGLKVMKKWLKSGDEDDLCEVKPKVGRRSYGLYLLDEAEDFHEENVTVSQSGGGGGGRRSDVTTRSASTEDISG